MTTQYNKVSSFPRSLTSEKIVEYSSVAQVKYVDYLPFLLSS